MSPLPDRRTFLRTASAAVAACAMPSIPMLAAGKAPNVLFIAVDDLRPQLGCFGHKQMISPHIDQLAAEGFNAARSYCTVPVCGASRASLLTGLRPTPGRFWDFDTLADKDCPEAVTLPRYFREHGYHTVSNGKVYHHLNDGQGSWSEPAWRPPLSNWRDYVTAEAGAQAERQGNGRGPSWEIADVDDSAYADGKIADKSIADLKRLKEGGSPFFLAAGFLKPHLPFNAPRKYWQLYKRDEVDLADNPFRPEGAPDVALHNWGELRAYAGIPATGPLSEGMARTLVHGYYACVSYADAQIGRLLAAVKELDLWEQTVVILWGDHGWNLGEHGLWCKHCNFETSLHSPLILSAPGYRQGRVTRRLTEFVDIYPTLCELAGLKQPGHLEGTSFVPLLTDPHRAWKKAAFSRFHLGDSIKTDRYRYTEWRGKSSREFQARMLYDHQTDPMENLNIAESPANHALVAELSRALQSGWKAALPAAS